MNVPIAYKNQKIASKVTCVNRKNDSSSESMIWHARLGHGSLTKLAHIPCIAEHINKSQFYCEACILAKFHRDPFVPSMSVASTPFELVYMDLWGPYKTPDLTGAHYFLTVVDDYTRCTWVYLLQNKMQTPTHIQNFIVYVQKHFNSQIKFSRSDNGTEFMQDFCSNLFLRHGIVHQRSVPKTPQQNGRVERKHRHIVETEEL